MTGNDHPPHPRCRIQAVAPGWLAAALMVLAGCSTPPPGEALRASITRLELAIEARESGAVSDELADDFVGPEGMDRSAARRLAQLSFMRHRDIGMVLGPLDITLQGNDHATVRFTAALTGGSGGWLPEGGRLYQVETGWRRDGAEWDMTSATWERDL